VTPFQKYIHRVGFSELILNRPGFVGGHLV
jgi:hypothetical protein